MKKLIILFFMLIIINNISGLNVTSDEIFKLTKKVSWFCDDGELKELSKAVVKYGKEYDIDPLLLIAIVKTESSFIRDIEGEGNCWGYFQINLNVHNVSDDFLNNIDEQTQMGAYVYSEFRKIFKNRHDSLNGYNGWVHRQNKYANKVLNSYSEYRKIIEENRKYLK